METIVTKKIVSHTLRVTFGYWDDESDDYVPISEDNKAEVAHILGCSVQMVDALSLFACNLTTAIHEDLVDIWVKTPGEGK